MIGISFYESYIPASTSITDRVKMHTQFLGFLHTATCHLMYALVVAPGADPEKLSGRSHSIIEQDQ
jgi:hypothetical protein